MTAKGYRTKEQLRLVRPPQSPLLQQCLSKTQRQDNATNAVYNVDAICPDM